MKRIGIVRSVRFKLPPSSGALRVPDLECYPHLSLSPQLEHTLILPMSKYDNLLEVLSKDPVWTPSHEQVRPCLLYRTIPGC